MLESNSWKSYTASDDHSVYLPPQIVDMLESNKFKPKPRTSFKDVFQNLKVGQSIILPHLGQEPKHFAEGYQGRTLLITEQMIDIWNKLSVDSEHSIKRVLSGPMGVGKSYISYFLASKAYAEGWITLYIADASDLDLGTSDEAGEVICKYFLTLNKDILTAADLEYIVRHVDRFSGKVEAAVVAGAIFTLLKTSEHKTLLIVDEHGALFENKPSVPERFSALGPLKNLNYWGEQYKHARVIFTGIAHAKYEREYVNNGTKQRSMIFVGPLQDNVFDLLLDMDMVLKEPSIRAEVKKVTNCVPREAMYLVNYIDSFQIQTNVSFFRQVLKKFEDDRTDEILILAQAYYNVLQTNERIRYYESLTCMFLPSRPTTEFDWKFLDLGIVYRYKEEGSIHYLPLCPSAQRALLKMYMSFDISENLKNQIRLGSLKGPQFEEVLFNRLVCKCNTTIQLNTTDLNNNNGNVLILNFNDYGLIKSPNLSLGRGEENVLGRGFDRYPQFDFMLGPIFIQISINDFTSHNNKPSTNISKAFEPMSAQAGISLEQINRRNQIEMYLDEMYGPGHTAKIDPQNKRFVVTRSDGTRVQGFRIVYIRGSPGIPNHPGKVIDFPDVAHVTFEEIKSQLFPNIV
jgi:hypothetical protein